MAEWWPFDRSWADELKRNWTEVLNMSSAAAQSLGLPQPGILPGDPFSMIVDAARTFLIGKKRTLPFSGHDLTMVLTDISVQGADLARIVGQYGQVTMTAEIRGSRLDIVVADTSTWKPSAAGGGRGQGLPMMRTFMDDVVLEPSARGTTVRMSRTVR